MMKPCIVCGEPSTSTRCPDHDRDQRVQPRGSARARGYDTAWDKVSKRARRLQPFCEDAHLSACSGPLTTDHKPSAWQRKADGKPIRLADVAVVCDGHNRLRGSSRAGSERAQTQGTGALDEAKDLGGKPQSRSHTGAAS